MENQQRMGNRLMKNQLMATPLQTRWRNVPLDGSPKQPYYGHANRSTTKQHAFFTARMSFMSAVSHISALLPVRSVETIVYSPILIIGPLYVFMPVTKFFLYDLRQSTLSYLRHLTFRAGCCCPRWVEVSQIEWKTTGEDLRKILFPHCSQKTLRPSPKRAQQVELLVKAHLWSRKSGYNACLRCSGRYTAWY